MTGNEKTVIYELLKTASRNVYGYTKDSFKNDPVFEDDKIISEEIDASSQKTGISENNEFSNSVSRVPVSQEKSPQETDRLSQIEEKILRCSLCDLCQTRKNAVPGEGVRNPVVLVIGEAPGETEDETGRPFTGKAGELLDKMLISIGLSRNTNCYIANTVKCRPPQNRDPKPEEREACRAYLDSQIALLKPKYILLLGRVAVRNFFSLPDETSLTPYRLKVLEYEKIPVTVTYHPSALLRNPDYKKPAWEDLKFLGSILKKEVPDYTEWNGNGR